MSDIGLVLIVVAVLLLVVGFVIRRRAQPAAAVAGPGARAVIDLDRPRPKVAEFHVRGEEAVVSFDVPVEGGDVDEVLRDLLVHEAVEVVREKRHTLPITGVTRVVALAGKGEQRVRVGEVRLPEPGTLPPPVEGAPLLHLGGVGADPLQQEFDEELPHTPPGLADRISTDELPPIGTELMLPRAVDVGLRAQGIDPKTMGAGDLVLGMLRLFGYRVVAADKENTYFADKGGRRTYLRAEPHVAGGYPQLEEDTVRQFVVDFVSAGADQGLLVTDKFAPFGIYDRERRDARMRFVTRERLQKFINALALE